MDIDIKTTPYVKASQISSIQCKQHNCTKQSRQIVSDLDFKTHCPEIPCRGIWAKNKVSNFHFNLIEEPLLGPKSTYFPFLRALYVFLGPPNKRLAPQTNT